MLKDYSREKLIQAIVFFGHRTRFLGKTKLFKLLYLMDFEHFRKTGKPITGLEYEAWGKGPVPASLYREWSDLRDDLAAAVEIRSVPIVNFFRSEVVPRIDFDASIFTRRELAIMEALANEFGKTYSSSLIDITHAQNGAWERVWRDGEGKSETIPYALALDDAGEHRDFLLSQAALYAGQKKASLR